MRVIRSGLVLAVALILLAIIFFNGCVVSVVSRPYIEPRHHYPRYEYPRRSYCHWHGYRDRWGDYREYCHVHYGR